MLVEELVQKSSGLISMVSDKQPFFSSLSRQTLTTRRCYCILSRLPFFELHFGVLNRCVLFKLSSSFFFVFPRRMWSWGLVNNPYDDNVQ